jgi:hypothetical protein
VTNREQLLQCLLDGLRARATAATNANAHSSRSHAVFTIRVRQTARRLLLHPAPGAAAAAAAAAPEAFPRTGGAASAGGGAAVDRASRPCFDFLEETLESKLHLVDLAGSERAGRDCRGGPAGAARLLESCSINQGLLALGNVIEALADKRRWEANATRAAAPPLPSPVHSLFLGSCVLWRRSGATRRDQAASWCGGRPVTRQSNTAKLLCRRAACWLRWTAP